MAEYVMKDLVKKANLESSFYIDSAGTSNEEDGNPVHYGTQNKLREEGIPCGNHRARQMTRKDYEEFDYLIGMEQWNIRNINRIIRKDPEHKVHLLLEYAGDARDIADPWYTGNFDARNVARLGQKTPCAVTGVCADCDSEGRICNTHLRMERCFPRKRITVILIDEEMGL